MRKELCKGMFTGVLSPFPPLVSPRSFFLREFLSGVLLSERLEQARSTGEMSALIIYFRPEICLCSRLQSKPDFFLVSIICKRARKALSHT